MRRSSPPPLSPTLRLAVRALCRCLLHGGLCMAPLSGAAPNTALPAPKLTATWRYRRQPACPGTQGFGGAALKAGPPWGEAESFMVQIPLNTPVMNHLQLCNAQWGTDCSQRPFKLRFPHPTGLCRHDPISSQPSWQCEGCAKLLHAWHPVERLHWGPAETSGQQVHGHKSRVKRHGCRPSSRTSNLPSAPESKVSCLGWGEKGKFVSKRLGYFGPSCSLGKLVQRERAQKRVSPPSPPPMVPPSHLCPAVGTGCSPWPVRTSTSQVHPRLGGHTAVTLSGPQALAGQTSAPVWTPSELQTQLESC